VRVSLSRRDVLWQLLFVALASRAGLSEASAVPSLSFPRQPRERLAVTSWPFRNYINAPGNKAFDRGKLGFDLKEFPSVVARRFGVHNINPLSAHFTSTDQAYLVSFREAVAKAGSHVVDLGLSGGKFYDPDRLKRQAGVDLGRQWIDIAVVVGSPSVRQHVAGDAGAKPDVTLAAESLGQLAEYGSKRNIVVNLENDNAVAEDPFFLTAVIEKVNSPYLRGLPDFGNSLPLCLRTLLTCVTSRIPSRTRMVRSAKSISQQCSSWPGTRVIPVISRWNTISPKATRFRARND
jgi:Xylose isomerase-like TIM barrel